MFSVNIERSILVVVTLFEPENIEGVLKSSAGSSKFPLRDLKTDITFSLWIAFFGVITAVSTIVYA